jgi:hypothetical protein
MTWWIRHHSLKHVSSRRAEIPAPFAEYHRLTRINAGILVDASTGVPDPSVQIMNVLLVLSINLAVLVAVKHVLPTRKSANSLTLRDAFALVERYIIHNL